MRKPIIAGNWKMFKTRYEALSFIYGLSDSKTGDSLLPSKEVEDCVICCPFTVLRDLVKRQGDRKSTRLNSSH